ncbi:Uncharacterised protein [Vibrio cholerae]|nr:Uncharacterised protein [Vibrio cholerae]
MVHAKSPHPPHPPNNQSNAWQCRAPQLAASIYCHALLV